jgi:hypothetical protein
MDFDVENLGKKYGDVPGIKKIIEVMSSAIKSGDIVLASEDDFLNFLRLCRGIANKILKGKKISPDKMFAPGEKLIASKEVAKKIGCEIGDITRMVKEGILNGVIRGRGSLVTLTSVNKYITLHPLKENPIPEEEGIQEEDVSSEEIEEEADKKPKDPYMSDFVRLGIALEENPPPEEKKKPEIVPKKAITPASKGVIERCGAIIDCGTGRSARPDFSKKVADSKTEKPREITILSDKDGWCDIRDIAKELTLIPAQFLHGLMRSNSAMT